MTNEALITHFQTKWEGCKTEFQRHAKAIGELRNVEIKDLRIPDSELYMSDLYDYKFDAYESLRGVGLSIVNTMIKLAEQELSGEAGRLSIPREEYIEKHVGAKEHRIPFEKTKAFSFKPSDLWNELQQVYGAGKGEEEGFRQAATEIINIFSFYEGDEFVVKGGYYTFNMRMWLDSLDKKWGKNRYSYGCIENFRKAIAPMSVFLRWAGEEQGALNLTSNTAELHHYSHEIISRQQYLICQQMALVTFHNRIEWRIGLDLGQKFQVFLGLFGIPLKRRDFA